MKEDHIEYGPNLPIKKGDVVGAFKNLDVNEPERMKLIADFIAERQAVCEDDPNPLTRAYLNISLGRLYIDIGGMLSEAKVCCECAKLIITNLLPKDGGKIPKDVQEACDEWDNLNGEIKSLEPQE